MIYSYDYILQKYEKSIKQELRKKKIISLVTPTTKNFDA